MTGLVKVDEYRVDRYMATLDAFPVLIREEINAENWDLALAGISELVSAAHQVEAVLQRYASLADDYDGEALKRVSAETVGKDIERVREGMER